MTDIDLIAARDDALDWVNEKRTQVFGLEPLDALPKGKRVEACQCPIARSLPRAAVCRDFTTIVNADDEGKADYEFNNPECVQVFVRAFDQGSYPELVEA